MAARHRRRRALAVAVAIALLALSAGLVLGAASGEEDPARSEGQVRVTVDARPVLEAEAERLRSLSPRDLAGFLQRIRTTRRKRLGRAEIVLETDRLALEHAVTRAARGGGGTVRLPERPVESAVDLPIVKQALRNNCETAALSMLLTATGAQGDQLALQREVPRSGPLDPEVDAAGRPAVWGDPDEGFVGRPEGGGTSGGYGVYPGPVAELGRRHGAVLTDVSGRDPAVIYQRLLSGRPVMAWVGLSAGPYVRWRSPAGKEISGNFGEHTVVLTGLRGDAVVVNDPLVGRRATWSRGYFEELWNRLGRRALST